MADLGPGSCLGLTSCSLDTNMVFDEHDLDGRCGGDRRQAPAGGAQRPGRNTSFVQTLLAADAVVIAGQAASHCVKSTIDELLGEIAAHDPALASKVYLVTDCMSAVTVPDGKGGLAADFTAEAEAALQRFADAGMNLVRSTDPLATWPGIRL